jgi:hypothetical protein
MGDQDPPSKKKRLALACVSGVLLLGSANECIGNDVRIRVRVLGYDVVLDKDIVQLKRCKTLNKLATTRSGCP